MRRSVAIVAVILSFLLFAPFQTAHASTVFFDDFSDVNGTTLPNHNPAWNSDEHEVIENNEAYSTVDDGGTLPGYVLTDQCVSMDVLFPLAFNGVTALEARTSPDGQTGYDTQINYIDGTYYYVPLFTFSPNGGYAIASQATIQPSAGWHNLKLCAIGWQITTYFDNSVLLSGIDPHQLRTDGMSGFSARQGNYIDNYRLESGVNNPPVVGSVSVLPNPAQINTSITATATFTDPDAGQTHTATADWGDGTNTATTCSVTEPSGSTLGSVSCPFSGYLAANVYPVSITVSDGTAQTTSATTYASVFDPIQSSIFSAGEKYANPSTANPGTTGNVKFGLTYKYKGGTANQNRAFKLDFNAANLHFNAASVASLVISGNTATLQGTGTLNGVSGYHFLVVGVDGGNIRIQISDASNNIVYDTQPGDAITAAPTTSVTGHVKVQ